MSEIGIVLSHGSLSAIGRMRACSALTASPSYQGPHEQRSLRPTLRIADTETAHALAIGLHRRYLGLFRTALGRSQ